jgi:hypothetical protein
MIHVVPFETNNFVLPSFSLLCISMFASKMIEESLEKPTNDLASFIETTQLDANVSQSPKLFLFNDFKGEIEQPEADKNSSNKEFFELKLRVAALKRDLAGDKARVHSGELIRKYLKFCQVEETKELEPFFPAADAKRFVAVARILRENREKYFEQPDRNMTWNELNDLIREYHPMVKKYPELLELMDFIRSKLQPHRQLPFRKVK